MPAETTTPAIFRQIAAQFRRPPPPPRTIPAKAGISRHLNTYNTNGKKDSKKSGRFPFAGMEYHINEIKRLTVGILDSRLRGNDGVGEYISAADGEDKRRRTPVNLPDGFLLPACGKFGKTAPPWEDRRR